MIKCLRPAWATSATRKAYRITRHAFWADTHIFPFPRKEQCTLFIKLFQGIKCPAIGHPANGRRENSNFGTGMEIVFICDTGYELIGNITLTCNLVRDQGVWSSQKPSCRSKTLALFFFFLQLIKVKLLIIFQIITVFRHKMISFVNNHLFVKAIDMIGHNSLN